MGWSYPSSSNSAKVAPTPSPDVSVKTKNSFSQFGVRKISAESNACLSLSKASNASGVACRGEHHLSKT